MAQGVNLTSQAWMDIVFQGKNKEFGAYQLRKKSSRRHVIALISIIILLIAIGLGVWGYLAYQEQKEQEALAAAAEMSAAAVTDQVEETPEEEEEEEVIYEEPEETPEVEDVASQAVTEINIVETVDKEKEVKEIDAIKEDNSQIASANVESDNTSITEIQNAVKDVAVVPQVKVEPKPEPVKKPEPEHVFTAVEQQASFKGNLNSWLGNNLKYPEAAAANNIEGKVIVQFVVEKDGSISNVTVARGVDKDLDREAVRVVKRMPKWNPGKNNGVAVRSQFTLPVVFKLQH